MRNFVSGLSSKKTILLRGLAWVALAFGFVLLWGQPDNRLKLAVCWLLLLFLCLVYWLPLIEVVRLVKATSPHKIFYFKKLEAETFPFLFSGFMLIVSYSLSYAEEERFFLWVFFTGMLLRLTGDLVIQLHFKLPVLFLQRHNALYLHRISSPLLQLRYNTLSSIELTELDELRLNGQHRSLRFALGSLPAERAEDLLIELWKRIRYYPNLQTNASFRARMLVSGIKVPEPASNSAITNNSLLEQNERQ